MKFTRKINQAFMFSARAHEGQIRKATKTPYFSHPATVAFILAEHTEDENVIIAALLHDVLEDVSKEGYGEQDIAEQFGETALKIIKECTESPKDKRSWHERKQEYLDRMKTCSIESLMIMLGDRLHNTQSLLLDFEVHGTELWKFFYDGKKGRTWFYGESLKNFIERIPNHPLVVEYQDNFNRIQALPEN